MKFMNEVVQLIEEDLGPARKKTGRWWFWECPFHPDKHPSLGVSMAEGNWHCFQCGVGGNAQAWLYQYRKIRTTQRHVIHPDINPFTEEKTIGPPNQQWQQKAQAYLQEWCANLWWSQGKSARWYLYGRGLNGHILEKSQISYNPTDRFDPLELWGLAPGTPKEKAVYIPAGICIPWIVDGQIWKINVRRSNKSPKYMQIKGGQGAVFGLDTLPSHNVAFLVEGEFDALLLEQEAGDLVGVCTLGSASSRNLSAQWQSHFLGCQRIFLVGDNDQAGQDWASIMSGISHRLKRANVPKGKDISEFWQMGGNLRSWVQEVCGEEMRITNNL